MHPLFEAATKTAARINLDVEGQTSAQLPEAASALLLVKPELWPWTNPSMWTGGGHGRKSDLSRAVALIMLEWERLGGSND